MFTNERFRFPEKTGNPQKDYDSLIQALNAFFLALEKKGALDIQEAARLVSSGPTGGIGYAKGAGGTVTQATNKGTGVTLDKVCGLITLNNANLGAGASQGFVFTNSNLTTGSILLVQLYAGYATPNTYDVRAETVTSGTAQIFLKNTSAGALAEAVQIRFAVIKAVDS